MNRPITSSVIESAIKESPNEEIPGPDGFIGKFYQTFKEEIMPILFKVFQNIKEKGPLPNISTNPALPRHQSQK